MSTLIDLQKIRNSKSDSLRATRSAAIQSEQKAQDEALTARRAVDDYLEEIEFLEVELLRTLMSKEMSPRDIDGFYETLENAKRKSEQLAKTLDDKIKALAAATETRKEAAVELKNANKANARLKELISEQEIENRKLSAKLQDQELDEFVFRGEQL